ncbi:efflux RND transporter periplasmic adaptor subunit [Dokdonella sp.]|uniref:efflux RND transporter periplasmic adaptor subunit n=1 Tax=Dokdonella sp. TaxID=2291710 RepID=UPI001B116751|nr:efflux RND transporter periplasmic adaptor subunit [Dokdonella sp.]MBO9664755.1 efflux RND transporter periplasmic adaptor subunit [Dokdonella sp.]
MPTRRLGWIALVALLAIALFASHRQRGYGRTVVQAVPVARGVLAGKLSLTGAFDYANVTEIRAEVVAPVAKLLVADGQSVRAGDALLELRAPDVDAEVDRLEATVARVAAELARAEVALRLARSNESRVLRLGHTHLIPQDRVETAQRESESAAAGVRAAQASLKEAQLAVRHARAMQQKLHVTAPVDGTVVDVSIREGEVAIPTSAALPGSLLLKLADTHRLIARVELSEAELGKLKVGDRARVRSTVLGGAPLPGEFVALRARAASGEQGRFQGEIAFAADALPTRLVHTSCIADVDLDGGEPGLIVPLEAIRYPGQNVGSEALTAPYVLRVGAGRIAMVPVETGLGDDRHQRIERGLREGDLVVTGPASVLATLVVGQDVVVDTAHGVRR